MFNQSCLSLDDCISLLRDGMTPKEVAEAAGMTEYSLTRLFESKGRLDEYNTVKTFSKSIASSKVDVDKVMELADQGITIQKACVMLQIPRSVVIKRLTDEGRYIEYYVRSISSVQGMDVPVIDPETYNGYRATLVSVIPMIPKESRKDVADAISGLDSIFRDAGRLSRMCKQTRD